MEKSKPFLTENTPMQNFTFKIRQSVFLLLVIVSFGATTVTAQTTTITGKVVEEETGETLVGVNILVKGKVIGTITDLSGNFNLRVNQEPPLTLIFSMVGFSSKEVEVSQSNVDNLKITLSESSILGQEVIVSASRIEESVLKSPVTVESMDIISIRNAPQPNFYDALNNMKGVEMNTQSLTFKSFNTRGFNANGNVRTVQLIDGMDNQAPGLNFSVGNIAGISELDLESVELLPGASSALYGPNAINGILLMNSKNPFQYQGLSVQMKSGIMSESGRTSPNTGFYDFSARYATAFSDRVALKVNVSYLSADDWQANDFRDQSLLNGSSIEGGTHINNPAYNGINIYGDESSLNLFNIASGAGLPDQILSLVPNTFVSRTGYRERDLADYNTESLKLNAALHWRINDRVEAILQGNYGTGTTVLTGADRYSITGFSIGQYKAELRGSNWFVRAYTTQERSGDSYAVGIAASGINEAWKSSEQWYGEYLQNFIGARLGGAEENTAHGIARNAADAGRYDPGSPQFNQALEDVRSRPIPGDFQAPPRRIGSRFVDKTNLYHLEGSYTLTDIEFADFVVGGNYRVYQLNSDKTLFATDENDNEFTINEFGGYVQGSKTLLNDNLKLTGSIRYDKNENFEGQFSPRISAVYTAGKHNFRASFQKGFRIPTTQDQYIDLLTPQARLVGGLPLFRERYNFNSNPIYSLATVTQFGGAIQQLAGTPAFQQEVFGIIYAQFPPGTPQNDPAVLAAVAQAIPVIAAQRNQDLKQPYELRTFSPEVVKSYEIGYKALLLENKLLIDGYYYYNRFENFIGGQVLIQDRNPGSGIASDLGLNLLNTNTRNVFSTPVNREELIKSYGWALGVDYQLPENFTIGGNVSFNKLANIEELDGFQPAFNTPEYRTNLTLANRNIKNKNIGFAVAWRWQDEFVWQSSFVAPAVSTQMLSVMPAFSNLDAQISYKLQSIKSIIKIGGSNLFSNGYRQAWGNPTVGTTYFVSITFDEFLN